jgi:hypothetical protein
VHTAAAAAAAVEAAEAEAAEMKLDEGRAFRMILTQQKQVTMFTAVAAHIVKGGSCSEAIC